MTHHLSALPRSADALKSRMSRTALELDYGSHLAGHGSDFGQSAQLPPPSSNPNQLLAALSAAEFERLSPHLELVPLPLGQMLHEPGRRLQYAYFPTTAVVSLHYVTESGAAAEAAGVGNEGIVGISLVMGVDTTPSSAVVQTAGHGYRLPGRLLLREFDRAGSMQRLLLRYTQALIVQTILTAACNQHHLVEQRLSRFLLSNLDRVRSRGLAMTQELIGSFLGVRREGIGEAIETLRQAGLISWRRGHMAVLDRSGLEARACECYSMVKAELSRLQSDTQSHRNPLRSGNHISAAEKCAAGASTSPEPVTLANWRRRAGFVQSDAR